MIVGYHGLLSSDFQSGASSQVMSRHVIESISFVDDVTHGCVCTMKQIKLRKMIYEINLPYMFDLSNGRTAFSFFLSNVFRAFIGLN